MKVWVTKHALTIGLCEVDVELLDPTTVRVTGPTKTVYPKPYWYESRKEAVAHAKLLRDRKLIALRRKIIQLESLNFD